MPSMSIEEFKQRLAGKIVSKEQFDKLLMDYSSDNAGMIGMPQVKSSGGGIVKAATFYKPTWDYLRPQVPRFEYNPNFFTSCLFGMNDALLHHSRWWLAREWLRIRYGIYQMSEPLWHLATHGYAWFAAHCAKDGDDPSQVAFTPDSVAGEADRQIRTTLSKLMRKFNYAVSDDSLRDLEASHRAEVSTELEVVPAGQPLVQVYLNSAGDGNGSCMTKGMDYFSYNEGYHPTLVYDAPGFGVAVIRAGDKIKSRSIVWVNPEDPKDKRYVRIYGDRALKRKLEMNGYRMAGFAGALLRRIDLKGHPDRGSNAVVSVATYLDAPGGNGSGVSELAATCVVPETVDGKPWFRLLSQADVELVQRTTGKRVIGFSATGGWVTWRPDTVATLADLHAKCAITGQMINLVSQRTERVYVDGRLQPALYKTVPVEWERAYIQGDTGNMFRCAIAPGTPTFRAGDYTYVDNERTRAQTGHFRLWSRFYGDTWFERDSVGKTVNVYDPNNREERKLILMADAAIVINSDDDDVPLTWTHIGMIPEVFNDDNPAQQVHRIHNLPTYVARSDPRLRTTVSGRKVVLGVHDVRELWDGRVDFVRNCDDQSWFGLSVWRRRDEEPKVWSEVKDLLFRHIQSTLAEYGTPDCRERQEAACNYVSDHVRYFLRPSASNENIYRYAGAEAFYYSPQKAMTQMFRAFDTARLLLAGLIPESNYNREYCTRENLFMAAEVYLMVEAAMKGRSEQIRTVPQTMMPSQTPPTPAMDERFVLAA